MSSPNSRSTLVGQVIAFCFLAVMFAFAATSCYSDPKSENSGGDSSGELKIGPEDSGSFVSEDGFVMVQFDVGTVSRPTTFKITRIPHENYPDQLFMLSHVYQFEPLQKLEKPVRVVFDLSGGITEDASDADLKQYFGSFALSLRKIVPGQSSEYVEAPEQNLELEEGAVPHRILMHQTDTLAAFAVYANECYEFCNRRVECDSYELDPKFLSLRDARIDCMKTLGCLKCDSLDVCSDAVDNLNKEDNQQTFYCSPRRPCRDSFEDGCCLEGDRCGIFEPDDSSDGDIEKEIDGDFDPDTETEIEDDQDGDVEPDIEYDDDQVGPDFSPKLCSDSTQCDGAEVCFTDIPNSSSGLCMPIPSSEVRKYSKGTGSWLLATDPGTGDPLPPVTACVGQPVDDSDDGLDRFDMKVVVDPWWKLADKADIEVELYHSDNLEVVQREGVTGADGSVVLSDVFAKKWIVIKTHRTSADPQVEVLDTWDWGIYVSKPEAEVSDLQGVPVEIVVHPTTAHRYNTLARALGINDGVPPGYGILVGQVSDCAQPTAYAMGNTVVGLMEATPLITGYFDQQFFMPTPNINFQATTKNGLFVGVYLPPQESLTAIAVGRARSEDGLGEPYVQLLGKTFASQLKLYKNSVSVVRFNTTH